MKKILTVVGARPQIIKAAAISRVLKNEPTINEVIVHTGQHYDANMSDIFYDELEANIPSYNLEIGSLNHANQTANMMIEFDKVIEMEKPDAALLYGDTNSTIAASLVAIKRNVPIIHVESGVRSKRKRNPEEINRFITDHLSALLFVPTEEGITNLKEEGMQMSYAEHPNADKPWVYKVDDIMLDNSLFVLNKNKEVDIKVKYQIKNDNFAFVTIHRPFNTDTRERLISIFEALKSLSQNHNLDIILPVHPRTKKIIEEDLDVKKILKEVDGERFKIINPISFTDTMLLVKNSSLVITDSGGMQKEAYFLEKPCIVLNDTTPWGILVEKGNNILTNSDKYKIISAYLFFKDNRKELVYEPLFGEGKASEKMVEILKSFLNKVELLS